MTHPASHPLLPYCPSSLAEQLLTGRQRILLYGEAGIGKSTLTNELALELSGKNQTCFCITADPGSPGFGLPGTVSLGQWQESNWQVLAFEALCTLDAGRFRLPLLTAVIRLSQKTPVGLLLIDAPGVVRGIAGSELLMGMVELLDIETVLVAGPSVKAATINERALVVGSTYPAGACPSAGLPSRQKDSSAQKNPAMAILPRC